MSDQRDAEAVEEADVPADDPWRNSPPMGVPGVGEGPL